MKLNILKTFFSFSLIFLIISCNNLQKEKELELKERELDLKEKELKQKGQKDFTRTSFNVKNVTMQKFNSYSSKIEQSKGAVIGNNEIFVGDLNHDELEDSVVWFVLTAEGGGNAVVGQGMSVYLNTGNDVKVVCGYEPDFLFRVIKIANNKVKIVKMEYAENDRNGWPSIETDLFLLLNGNTIIESN